MKSAEVKHFSQTLLIQKFGEEYQIVAKRDLVRMRGPFVQSILLGIKRSGSLKIIPTFYVIGANPKHEVMFQTMSLPISGVDRDRKWLVFDNSPLDEALAERLIKQLKKESPISYFDSLSDEKIHRTLKKFTRRKRHWSPSLSLAFWEIITGAKSAAKTLEKSKWLFVRYSRYSTNKEPLEYEKRIMERYGLLQDRITSSDGILRCREEAEEHAVVLKLPKIEWPPEWPT